MKEGIPGKKEYTRFPAVNFISGQLGKHPGPTVIMTMSGSLQMKKSIDFCTVIRAN